MSFLKKHEETAVDIECWDDDDLEVEGHEFGFRGASLATSHAPSHRDSISSRRSFRSDYESNFGDENKELHLPGDDDRSTMDAIEAATKAGVPIPKGVPASALMGGTIKRLGGKKIKKVIEDDWELDMDLPNSKDGGLKLKYQDPSNFPDNLRRVSGPGIPRSSPAKTLQPPPKFNLSRFSDSHNSSLDRFREEEDDSDLFGDVSTIKIPKRRQPQQSIVTTDFEMPSKKKESKDLEEDMEQGLEFPDGPLQLSASRDIPKTPARETDDFDWGDGSLGTRFGGTRRDMRSTRSSSVSGMSPSVSSSFTVESEDEDLKGLIFPTGPLRFTEILEKRQQDRSPDRLLRQPMTAKQSARAPAQDDDFLKDLEIGNGDVFTTKTLTFNKNVQVRPLRQNSPIRTKTAVSLTFTNKTSVHTRLSRGNTERPSMSLAPVLESGGSAANKASRFQPRHSHSAQSSVSSTTTPTTPSSTQSGPPVISTPRRRELRSKPSALALGRGEPTTTSAQLLKSKRSMPILSSYNRSPPKPSGRSDRPTSRVENFKSFVSRPKTPVDRFNSENNLPPRKNPAHSVPAGTAQSQSHHAMNKNPRYPRRNDSSGSNNSTEMRPVSRAFSRLTLRSPSPHRLHRSKTTEALAREAAAKRTLSKPIKKRNYGDGGELDGFDDLPTSQQVEQKYMKTPSQRGPPKTGSLRKRLGGNAAPEGASTPSLSAAFSPPKTENLPRFARDTNASRIAREQVLAQRAPSVAAHTVTASNNLKSHARTGLSSPSQNPIKSKKPKKHQQLKPHLIKPLGNTLTQPKAVNGMVYNVDLHCWEGNETDLAPFEPEVMTPRPALISNVNGLNGPQLSGGMFFDPRHMAWFKLTDGPRSEDTDTMDGFDAFDDDTFAGIDDLKDNPSEADESGMKSVIDHWPVGEEFDVGPRFCQGQNDEEDRWRRKCEKWCGCGGWLESDGEGNWRWVARRYVNQDLLQKSTEQTLLDKSTEQTSDD